LTHNLYGAKIDNDYDAKILNSLVENLFNVRAFDATYSLFNSNDPNIKEIKMPEVNR